jgi:uncharacterized paraquat-inducible protein A
MIQVYCCERCLTDISKESMAAADFWCHLCYVMAIMTPFNMTKNFANMDLKLIEYYLSILEKAGLVVTHENDCLDIYLYLKSYQLQMEPHWTIYCAVPNEHEQSL